MCNFSYSLDGKKFLPLGNPFQAREGQWIGAKVGMFCTRPAIVTNDGGWTDVDWFRITRNDSFFIPIFVSRKKGKQD